MTTDATREPASTSCGKSTGSLEAPLGSLQHESDGRDFGAVSIHSVLRRNLAPRVSELLIFLLAVIGAVAFGLGIADYLGEHPYISAYLVAYAAFRFADILVGDDAALGMEPERVTRSVLHELPVLLLFAAAPFERTYLYGGEAPRWLAALGLLLELAGLWLVLGSRIQLGFFSSARPDKHRALIRSGLYRYIRHPIYAGEFLVLFAWPFEYGAPITLVLMIIIGIAIMRRWIAREEAELLARYGDEYASYQRETDNIIPNVW